MPGVKRLALRERRVPEDRRYDFSFSRSRLEGVEVEEGVPLAVPPQPCPFT